MTKATKTKAPALIDDYVKKKLAIQKQDGYYGIIDGVEVLLGRHVEDASENLEALIADGKQPEPVQTPKLQTEPSPIDEIVPESDDLKTALEKVQSTVKDPKVREAIENTLKSVVDLKPTPRHGIFVVYVDGVESDRVMDPSIPETHLVKTIPFVFFWLPRAYNVESGEMIVNGDGWTVLDKSLARAMKITTYMDNTPDLNYFTVKKMVLCIARKDQFLRKKTLERLRGNMALPKMLKQREEQAKHAAKLSKTNIEASTQVFGSDMASQRQMAAESMHVASDGRMTVEQAQVALENMTVDNLAEVTRELDQASKVGFTREVSDSEI